MGARKQGKGKYGTYPHPRCKMYKARFVSITTSWFAQKELKSLPPSTYHRLIIAAAGELAELPQTPSWIMGKGGDRAIKGRERKGRVCGRWGGYSASLDPLLDHGKGGIGQ